MDDPRAVLGVGPDATAADVRRARRRLAKALHPDLHDARTRDDAERRMALVNRAFDQLVQGRTPGPLPSGEPADGADPVPAVDAAFAIEAPLVDAFEATLLAAVELGDVVRSDEPHLLAVLLDHPGPCQCVLELTAGAGATTVTIEVAPRHFGACPGVGAVRDAFLAEISRQWGR